MTPEQVAAAWEARVLGEIAFALILAGLIVGYVAWEWRTSATFRAQRRAKR
jgi:hypothetical protein